MMLLFLVFVAVIKFTLADPTFSNVKEWEVSKVSDKFDSVEDYVHYELYFQRNDSNTNSQREQVNNRTAALFSAAIDTCTIKNFSPRVLESRQVSLKRQDGRPKRVPHNESESPANASSAATAAEEEEGGEDKGDVVHEYLAIALVLPGHPFSRALIDAMRIVSPMYPSVTSYMGIATEFQSLCNQYSVRSYPNLLLFHKGLLVDKLSNVNGETYRPAQLAKWFSTWTNKLPRSVPVPLPRRKKSRVSRRLDKNSSVIELQNLTALAGVVTDWLSSVDMRMPWSELNETSTSSVHPARTLDFGESIEPLVSISADPRSLDVPVYLLAAAYVFLRCVFCVTNTVLGWQAT